MPATRSCNPRVAPILKTETSESVEEARRHAYLRAMGINLWVPRLGALDEASIQACDSPTRPQATQAPESKAGASKDPTQDLLYANPSGMDWAALEAAVAVCRACPLYQTRTQTVFGVGDRQARLLVIGEAPGADEDREGEPFVGRAGQLLDRMLAAIGLSRGEVYIANILKCRPPGNRDPRQEEVSACQGFLSRQVELIGPQAILSLGRISAHTLLGTETPVGRLRGRWFEYGAAAIPLRVTYHPAYLLRSPEHKGKAWEDLTELRRRLGTDRP